MNKKLLVLPILAAFMVGCGNNDAPKKPAYSGPKLSAYSEVVAGNQDDIFSIAGYVSAQYMGAQTGGIYVATGDETILCYAYSDANIKVGDFVRVTGGRNQYDGGRVVEVQRNHKVGSEYVDYEGAGIEKIDLDAIDQSTLGVTVAKPVDYTFDGAAWAGLTTSTTPADWTKVTGRKVSVEGTIKSKSATSLTANQTVTVTVGTTDVAVYLHKTNDSETFRQLALDLEIGAAVTVSGVIGSYKGATQIVCVQAFAAK